MHAEACEATRVRGEQSEELLDLRMDCLRSRLQELKATADVLAKADRAVVERAVPLAQGLAELDECANTALLRMVLRPVRDPETRKRLHGLGELFAQARALGRAGHAKDGLPVAEAALAEVQMTGWRPMEAEGLHLVGTLQQKLGREADAEKTLRRALLAATAGRNDPVAADAARLLVHVVGSALVRPEEGLALSEQAFALLERLGEDPTRRAALLRIVARLHGDQGRHSEAAALLEKALAALEAQTERPDQREIGAACLELGTQLRHLGKYAEAATYLQRALDLWQRENGSDHPLVALAHQHFGGLCWTEDRYAEAGEHYAQALRILEQAYGPEHPQVADAINGLALVRVALGAYREAEELGLRAIKVYEKTTAPNHPSLASAYNSLCNAQLRLGHYRDAEATCRHALDLRQGALAEHPATANPLHNLARALSGQGQHEAALALHERALALRQKTLGPTHSEVAVSMGWVGEELLLLRRCPAAVTVHQRALALQEANSASAVDRAATLEGVGASLLVCGSPAEAIAPLERALAMFAEEKARLEYLGRTRFVLARALWETARDRERALSLAQQAREDFASAQGDAAAGKATEVAAWLTARAPFVVRPTAAPARP
ncbi:MAG: tetratricopeptide repeat protein [Myxococcales bacterium]